MSIIRLAKDIKEVQKMRNVQLSFINEGDMSDFIVKLKVSENIWRNKWFRFKFHIPKTWPIDQPVVTIMDDIWHPNIKLVKDGGKVCVSVFGSGYSPSYILATIVISLQYLLQNPNPNDAYNVDAAHQYLTNHEEFKAKAQEYLDRMEDDDDEEEEE